MSRDTVDQYRGLHAHELARARLADGDRSGSVHWRHHYTAEVTAEISYAIELGPDSGRFVLIDLDRVDLEDGPDGQVARVPPSAVQRLDLVTSRPRYGGLRWWWACPRCGRRVATLYQNPHGGPFVCRHDGCHGLSYTSRQESGRFARLIRRMERVGLLKPHPGPAERPTPA
jgi:hypothetical protein